MKRIVAMACILLALLAACAGGGEQAAPEAVDAAQLAVDLLEREGLFSDTLEEVEREVGLALYGIAEEDLAQGEFYLSGGATAEELSVLTAADAAGAERIAQACRARVDRQREALRDYQPQEAKKLEAAAIQTQGLTVICMVPAAGQDGAQVLESLLTQPTQ